MKSLWVFLGILLMMVAAPDGYSQEWKLKKQEDGVTIYVRPTDQKGILEYKAKALIASDMKTIYHEIVDFDRYPEWMDDMKHMEVLEKEEGSFYVYFLTYDVPWPFKDRDMVARATVKKDSSDGSLNIESHPTDAGVPEKDNTIRIQDFWQNWRLTPVGNDTTRVILEGYNDPGGSIPSWLVNWGVVDTPFAVLKNLKKRLDK